MDMKLELVVIPVTDVDRAKAFYERCGFDVDVDHVAGDDFRVVQVTPPGSAASVCFGIGVNAPDSPVKGLHLVVTDIEAAVAELRGRGVEVGEPFHFGAEGKADGVDPQRQDYATFAQVDDPDGNIWLLQEVASRG
jgi:catechol 2,3-dioxygenase-like lactoylglutathione lyase family enzyme